MKTTQLALFTPQATPTASPPARPRGARSPRARARKANPVYQPWPCAVLGIDTASVSGWAVRLQGRLMVSGQCRVTDESELDAVIQEVCSLSCRHQLPAVCVLERAFGHRTNVLLQLGAARGAWLAAWKRAKQPAARVVSVYPMTWRAALGVQAQRAKRVKGEPRSWAHIREKRAEQERIELAAARMEVAAAISGSLGPDEAAAILISRWAAHAREVNAVIPKRQRRVIDHG